MQVTQSPATTATGYPNPFLRMKQLGSSKGQNGLLPISEPQIWRLVKSGAFPKPVSFGATTAWRTGEVEAWLIEKTGTDLQGRVVNAESTGLPKLSRSPVTVRGGKGRAKKSAAAAGGV